MCSNRFGILEDFPATSELDTEELRYLDGSSFLVGKETVPLVRNSKSLSTLPPLALQCTVEQDSCTKGGPTATSLRAVDVVSPQRLDLVQCDQTATIPPPLNHNCNGCSSPIQLQSAKFSNTILPNCLHSISLPNAQPNFIFPSSSNLQSTLSSTMMAPPINSVKPVFTEEMVGGQKVFIPDYNSALMKAKKANRDFYTAFQNCDHEECSWEFAILPCLKFLFPSISEWDVRAHTPRIHSFRIPPALKSEAFRHLSTDWDSTDGCTVSFQRATKPWYSFQKPNLCSVMVHIHGLHPNYRTDELIEYYASPIGRLYGVAEETRFKAVLQIMVITPVNHPIGLVTLNLGKSWNAIQYEVISVDDSLPPMSDSDDDKDDKDDNEEEDKDGDKATEEDHESQDNATEEDKCKDSTENEETGFAENLGHSDHSDTSKDASPDDDNDLKEEGEPENLEADLPESDISVEILKVVHGQGRWQDWVGDDAPGLRRSRRIREAIMRRASKRVIAQRGQSAFSRLRVSNSPPPAQESHSDSEEVGSQEASSEDWSSESSPSTQQKTDSPIKKKKVTFQDQAGNPTEELPFTFFKKTYSRCRNRLNWAQKKFGLNWLVEDDLDEDQTLKEEDLAAKKGKKKVVSSSSPSSSEDEDALQWDEEAWLKAQALSKSGFKIKKKD